MLGQRRSAGNSQKAGESRGLFGFLGRHVAAGTIALLPFWGAAIAAKRGSAHRRWGRLFTVALYAASGMALRTGILSRRWLLAMHPALTDARRYRGLFGWLMIYLALLAICTACYDRAMITKRRDDGANRRWPMLADADVSRADSGRRNQLRGAGRALGQPLMVGIGLVGFGTMYSYLRCLARLVVVSRAYLPQHPMMTLGTGIAAYAAFVSVGSIELFPAHAFSRGVWALPPIVGLGLMAFHLRRFEPGRARMLAAEQASKNGARGRI